MERPNSEASQANLNLKPSSIVLGGRGAMQRGHAGITMKYSNNTLNQSPFNGPLPRVEDYREAPRLLQVSSFMALGSNDFGTTPHRLASVTLES